VRCPQPLRVPPGAGRRGDAGRGERHDRRADLPPRPAARRRASRPPGLILLLPLLLALLAAPGAWAQGNGPPLRDTLVAAFETVAERYLRPTDPADLAVSWLRGLAAVEPRLSARLDGRRIELRLDGQPLAWRPRPTSHAAAAAEAARLARDAIAASPALQRARGEALLAAGFDEMFLPLDPFSRYVPPAEAAAARAERIGQAALGLRLGPGRRGAVVVTQLLPGSAAAEAGVVAGDEVLAIDGVPVGAADLALAALLLDGPEGTAAVLRLRRAGRLLTVRIARRGAAEASLAVETRPDGVLLLRVAAFPAGMATRVQAALAAADARGLVLDLRGNRGGVLTEALAVADLFLDSGRMASAAGRHRDAGRVWEASPPDAFASRPVVVLVDGRTASAAEVLAAALADRGRGAVVGSATRGKGLIQIVVPLPGEAELHLSWAELLTPSGRRIEGAGLAPTLCTSLGEQAADQGLAALARPRAASACPPSDGRPWDERIALALIADPQAYRAALGR
jgi:carboxyl-terminal processing protease